MKITVVLCVRNEAAFLLDWLAWHRSVGVTDFVVVSNECADGTDDLLDRLAELGCLTHIRNAPPYGKGGIQFSGLKLANKAEAVRKADWLLTLDIDEFVTVHAGDGTLPDLIHALPEATAITLTWRVFGNCGVVEYVDDPVPVQFTRAAPRTVGWPWRLAMFKTLYRNDKTYRALGVHRPRNPVEDRLPNARWYDGEGRRLGSEMATGRLFSDYTQNNNKLVQLNHYPLGSIESYVLKSDRGRAVHSADSLGLDYWVERNLNTDEDRSAADLWHRAQPFRDAFAADPVVAELHAKAVDWRKAKLEELLRQDRFRDLYGRLLMAQPSRALSKQDAARLTRAAQRSRDASRVTGT
ncbi:glycosyltransferase family 2 protein [Marivita hallyeonensis]|uniref:Glycosyl transferase family 2 n=1 Tax=Marivita hallyeonensis TaxID=996342 RepID=A0A1M5VVH2_9RHOB|nr:glycosyltransferase family 2 protein [Marivita hallyeonensis]SHH79262.1 Glycosyl transferase family 2 [Marivita hallyeonensis]